MPHVDSWIINLHNVVICTLDSPTIASRSLQTRTARILHREPDLPPTSIHATTIPTRCQCCISDRRHPKTLPPAQVPNLSFHPAIGGGSQIDFGSAAALRECLVHWPSSTVSATPCTATALIIEWPETGIARCFGSLFRMLGVVNSCSMCSCIHAASGPVTVFNDMNEQHVRQ